MPDSLEGRLGRSKRRAVFGSDIGGDSAKGWNTAWVSPLPRRGECAVSTAMAITNGNKRTQMRVPICARLFSRPCFPLNVSTTRKRHSLSRPDAALGIFHTCMLKSGRRLHAIGETKPANNHAHQKRSHLRVCLSLRQVQTPLCFLSEVQHIDHRRAPVRTSRH
jgi:hypothetical protein